MPGKTDFGVDEWRILIVSSIRAPVFSFLLALLAFVVDPVVTGIGVSTSTLQTLASEILWLFSDCWAFVKVARRFLEAKRTGFEPRWPTANLDLWIRFWEALNGLDCGRSIFVWIKAHVDPCSVAGVHKIRAFFNNVVDGVAKHIVHSFGKMSTVYQRLVQDFSTRLQQAGTVR